MFVCEQYLMCVSYFVMNLNIVQYLYVNNVLYVYNCIHEKAIKSSCILYLIIYSWF